MRDNKGRFLKGSPGNPNGNGGRPKEEEGVRKLARAHTKEALETILGIMRTSTKDQTRLAAANILLDRGYGKPTQQVDMTVEQLDDKEVLEQTWEILRKIQGKNNDDEDQDINIIQ